MAQYYIPRPFVYPGPMPMAHPPVDPLLISLTAQIDYYFSDENLIKDVYLKQHMDGQGWVPISLIAGFNRVKQMTTDIQIILNAVRASTLVELKDGKIRRRVGWTKWILPSMNHVGNLAVHVQNMGLEEGSSTHINRSSSGEITQSHSATSAGTFNGGESGHFAAPSTQRSLSKSGSF
ncbi:hypothetical protein QJS10_CPA01g00368 [Acorus calamus]|uniref:HTH La-type RNA-binding domain-containing protein n=1 Tax=Acorus calamus TaxID=4465 RepID=A0AAV9FH62_ACOCL|nr:hypothetical protein QJS10_CPA01g00368 [Acorus calamus]